MSGMLAIANVGRAAAFRSGYFVRDVVPVTIGGAARTGVIQSTIRIDLNTGDEPHRCAFDFKGGSGFVPQPGQTITVGHGTTANRLFAGRLLTAKRVARRNDDRRPTYQCDAAGWLFDIDQSRVFPGFSVQSLSPNSLVQRLFLSTSPNVSSLGFTANNISAELSAVEEFSTGPTEPISQALARVFRTVDASWYMDHVGDVHAFPTINSLPAVPATITSAASHVWNVSHQVTDFSRIFTRAHVQGATQATLADFDPTRHTTVPLSSASLIANANGSFGDDTFVNTSESWLFDGVELPPSFFYTPESQFNAGQASVFLPASRSTNTLVVVAANVLSLAPIDPNRWYDISGQMLYVASTVGVFSATASSIAYAYYLHPNGSGAITADINAFADIASPWNLTVTSPTLRFGRTVPAGATVQAFVTRVNTTGRDYVTSLTTSAAYGLISRTFEDQRLSVDGAIAVANAALERGNPANWTTLGFSTREENYDVGGPVFVAMSSPAEPSGNSIVGTFTVHDMTIEGFDSLTPTRGPVRVITAGAVRRPTLWQVLQGV